MLDLIFKGIFECLMPLNLLANVLSVVLGIMVGCLPGFGAATGLVLVLPLTYTMDPSTALIVLTGIYLGAEYGGSISAILINTPGTACAVMTCFDGYPLAKQGKARDALIVSNIASCSGGIFGGLVMLFCMPLLGTAVLKLGAGEVFLMASVGLLLVGSITKGSRLKGIVSVCIGVAYTFVGTGGALGVTRFTFGHPILVGGLPLIAGMLAMFAIPQMLEMAMTPLRDTSEVRLGKSEEPNFRLFGRYLRLMYSKMIGNMLRSSIFGVLIGIVPGVGSAVSSMVSYASAKKRSKHPETFGSGNIEGVAASEAANNATVGGSLIPVLALGIPGSPAAALFMAAIFMHGMTPGPNFLVEQANLVYILIMAVFLCSIVQLFLGLATIGSFANILKVPRYRLFPAVMAVCCIGAYVVRSQDFDLGFFLFLGLLTYVLSTLGFNMGAIVLGAFLAPTLESALTEAMSIAPSMGGLIPYFLSRKIAMGMLAFIVCYIGWLLYSSWKSRPRGVSSNGGSAPGRWMGFRGVDFVIFAILLALTVFLWKVGLNLPYKSRVFPNITFLLIMVCSVIGLLQCVFFGARYHDQNVSPLATIPWKKFIVLGVFMIAYFVLIEYSSFYIATVPYILVNCLSIRQWHTGTITRKNLVWDIVFAVICTVAIYGIFTGLFQSEMPVSNWFAELTENLF